MQKSLFDPIDDDIEKENIPSTKDQEIENEINELLDHVSSTTVNTLRDKVGWILNFHPETRDSDITLQLKFWEAFEGDKYNGHTIHPNDLYKLTKLTSLARERARIQNVYKLFTASQEIQKKRGTLSEEEKEKAIEDRPSGIPGMTVYMDESGKNERNLIVGSVWLLFGGGHPFLAFQRRLNDFKSSKGFNDEFHFSNMSRHDLPIYKEMVKIFLKESSFVSFKVISLNSIGIIDKQKALGKLYYYLLLKGIEDEDQKGRALLPRQLNVWKDEEEEGSDHLLVADLEDQLKQVAVSRLNKKLYINTIRTVDSKNNIVIQVADLLAASVNRILNPINSSRNHKDEFAEFFLEASGVGKSFENNDRFGDMTVHISL